MVLRLLYRVIIALLSLLLLVAAFDIASLSVSEWHGQSYLDSASLAIVSLLIVAVAAAANVIVQGLLKISPNQ